VLWAGRGLWWKNTLTVFKIHSHRLQRADEVIHIDVHESMNGMAQRRSIAAPIDVPLYRAKETSIGCSTDLAA